MVECNNNDSYYVEALGVYEEKGIKDNGLDRIPKAGDRFYVTKERLNVLLGNNKHNLVFVKVVEEPKEEKTPKKVVKKKKTK
jgi:hypothetical protein